MGLVESWIVPAEHAALIASGVVFGLAFLVLMGVWLRPAALLLAIVVFWSSFIEQIGTTGPFNLDSFWRDLALIGALFLTYAQSGRAARLRSIVRRRHHVRKLRAGNAQAPRRITPTINSASTGSEPPAAPATPAAPLIAPVPRLVYEVDVKPVPIPQFRTNRRDMDAAETSKQEENIFTNDPSYQATA